MAPNANYYMDYEKISDTLLYFSQDIAFKFSVLLARRRLDGSRSFFSREVRYQPPQYNSPVVSIKREMQFYFSIDDKRDFTMGVQLRPNDVMMLGMVLANGVNPWIIGKSRIFGENPDTKQLMIKGKWKEITFVLSDSKYMKFYPIVMMYEDGKTIEGIRIVLNSPSNYVDIEANRYFSFFHLLTTTDMYACAIGLVNYIKRENMGANCYDMISGTVMSSPDNENTEEWDAYKRKENKKEHGPNFFDKL